ncbi:MAG TPA: DUF3078 domain-containing protein, partial [Flavisolibacter sp.]|nr:DUF3078 domain-containing protein [Flavisolibacter sp.]
MRRIVFTTCALCLVFGTWAQTGEKPKNPKWKQGGSLSLSGGQTGSRNWTAAPEKFSLTGLATLHLFGNKTWGKNTWENSLDLAYALTNTESAGIRKLDDKIDLYTRYAYWFKSKVGAGAIGNVRTQFSNGIDYREGNGKRISGFFAPAFITIGAGIQLKPVPDWTVSVGPAIRWVLVTNAPYSLQNQGGIKPDGTREKTLAEIYGVDPAERSRTDIGGLLSTTFNKTIAKNVAYRARLDLLADVKNHQEPNASVYWTNTFTMSVNKWLKVNYNFDLIYDDQITYFGDNKNEDAVQMKSILGVGLAVG